MPDQGNDPGDRPADQLKGVDIPARAVLIRGSAAATAYDRRMREAQVSSEETRNAIEEEHLNKLRQQQRQRRTFFVWAMFAISAVLFASAIFMTAYMLVKGNQTEPTVIIAWLSSGLVETLGLGYIIANYLFEQSGNQSPEKKKRKKNGGRGKSRN